MRLHQRSLTPALVLALAGCASSNPRISDVRTVTHREDLVDCTKVGIVAQSSSNDNAHRLSAQAASLGGNTIVLGNVRGIHPYVEVWSCPVEATR